MTDTPSDTEWRAELVQDSDEVWRVVGEDGWEIVSGLNEPTARLSAAALDMQKACEAAQKYDEAIAACGNDPAKMASFCTAQGDTLDALYLDWINKSCAALEKSRPQ